MKDCKLIITDIDGTLRSDTGSIPADFFSVADSLYNKGVRIAIASGRQLKNMQQLFEPHTDRLLFIAHNGATIADGRKILYDSTINPIDVSQCISFARSNNLTILLYNSDTILTDDNSERLHSFLSSHFVPFTLCNDLTNHTDGIAKLSFVDLDGGIHLLKNDIAELNIAAFQANPYMIDVTAIGTNKGTAIRQLCKMMDTDCRDICAFGDSENDIDMLTTVGHAYAVANAPDKVKAVATVIPSNNDGGVITTLKALFNL